MSCLDRYNGFSSTDKFTFNQNYDRSTLVKITIRIYQLVEKAQYMKNMKWVYYGFGAFIGFSCGTVIEFIFYLLEQSGNRIISNMIRDYGILGRFIAEMVSSLPYMGLALGIIMIYWLFPEVVSDKKNHPEE